MKVSSLKMPAVVALVLAAVTSADAAMPVPRASGDSSLVLVGCAYGWYRGPDGQCYVGGTGPGYYGGYYRRWHRPYYGYYRSPYRAYPYYGGYPYYGRPYEYDEDDD
jgi:hypothetical protein